MGVVQSKKKGVKAYTNKYTSSLRQSNSSTSASTHTQSSHSSNNKKNSNVDDNRKKTSVYSVESVPRSSTPIPSSINMINTTTMKYNVSPPIKSMPTQQDLDEVDYYIEQSLYNVHQSNSFYLPKDWDSQDYQYNLHFALKTLYGGNVTPAVVPKLKKDARVVQMGTCSGPWIMDMATQYPECYFTAVEIVPDSLQALPMLPNIAFDREPYQQGLNFADNSIDYIHLRSMGYCVGLQNWNALMKEVYRILKPDGLIRIEEIDHSPTGTVMIESFFETLRQIMTDHNLDYDMSVKYGKLLPKFGFQVIETKKKRVTHASDGKLSEDFTVAILNGFDRIAPILGPQLGLSAEDYRHRIEMICSECVRVNANMDWYSYVAKKST